MEQRANLHVRLPIAGLRNRKIHKTVFGHCLNAQLSNTLELNFNGSAGVDSLGGRLSHPDQRSNSFAQTTRTYCTSPVLFDHRHGLGANIVHSALKISSAL